MTFFFLIAAGIAYFLKAHVVALVFVGLSIAEQLLVMLRASIDPEWYIHRRIEANQDVDLMPTTCPEKRDCSEGSLSPMPS